MAWRIYFRGPASDSPIRRQGQRGRGVSFCTLLELSGKNVGFARQDSGLNSRES